MMGQAPMTAIWLAVRGVLFGGILFAAASLTGWQLLYDLGEVAGAGLFVWGLAGALSHLRAD